MCSARTENSRFGDIGLYASVHAEQQCALQFGLISTAIQSRTGLASERISFAIAIAQLLYGLSQPFFGILALKKSNSFVLGLGGILMGAGLLLIPASRSVLMLDISLGLLVGLAAGALAFGVVMGAAAPALGYKYAATASGIAMVFHQIGSFISTWFGSLLIASSGDYTAIWLCGAFVASGAVLHSQGAQNILTALSRNIQNPRNLCGFGDFLNLTL